MPPFKFRSIGIDQISLMALTVAPARRSARDAKLIDWFDEITADCPKKRAHNMNDQCGARCPDLPSV
jgi:hypothetical protein